MDTSGRVDVVAGHLNDGPQERILLRKLDGQFNGLSVLMDRAYKCGETRSLLESLGMTPLFPPRFPKSTAETVNV